jgi:hypothetical protein
MSTGLFALWTRHERPEAFRSTGVAAACLAAAHAIFWTVVQPVNTEVMEWPLDAIRPMDEAARPLGIWSRDSRRARDRPHSERW